MRVPEKREDITLDWLNTIFAPHHIKVHGFTFGSDDVSHGRGFMGNLEEVELEVTRLVNNSSSSSSDRSTSLGPECGNREKLSLVLKTLPKDAFRKRYASNDGFCSREVSMYTEVFKTWTDFLDSRQVPSENRFRHPTCYYGAEEGEGEDYKYILVLENLLTEKEDKDLQYDIWKQGFFHPLPIEAVEAVIREVAKMHATGIAYKMEHGNVDYAVKFPKLNHVVSEIFDMMWDNAFKITRDVIEEAMMKEGSPVPEGLLDQLERLKEEKQLLLKWFTDSTLFKRDEYSTICHHDLHSNNVVLNGYHSKAVLFDYQACCVFNPMKDLSFFLVLNCSSDLTTKNRSKVLQIYQNEFEKTMRAIKMDFPYPLEKMTKDYDRFLAFSLTHIMSGAQVWVTGEGSTDESKKRFVMAIIDAFERGWLVFPTLPNND